MAPRTTGEKKKHEGMRVDLGVAYGLIAGAGVGSLLMALTGDVMWVSIGPSLGLLIGLAVASLYATRDDPDGPDDGDGASDEDDPTTP